MTILSKAFPSLLIISVTVNNYSPGLQGLFHIYSGKYITSFNNVFRPKFTKKRNRLIRDVVLSSDNSRICGKITKQFLWDQQDYSRLSPF